MNLLKKIYHHIFKADLAFKFLLIKVFFYSFYVRFLMLFVKYKRYEKRLGERGKVDGYIVNEIDKNYIHRIQKAVVGVSNYTPWESKCMVQAVSAKWLLKKKNISSTIYFGIMKDPEDANKLKAHAWLKVGDWVVTGRAGHQQFKIVNFYS